MRKLALSVVTLVAVLCLSAGPVQADDDAVMQVRQVVERGYVNGAFNALDPDAMEAGFHPDFAIFSPDGQKIGRYPIADWVAGTRKRKASADFDPAKNVWKHEFVSVDVTGHSAAVQLNLSKDGKLIYTDYLLLLNFEGDWRIVAKVYHNHAD